MSAETSRISVALCTYNGEKFLREQLDSIAAQTLPPNELIASDDGSTDATLSILREFANEAAFPVRILRTEGNLGSTKNFEKAIEHCTGEVIALADQDDIWLAEKLKNLWDALAANPDAAFVISDSELIDSTGNSMHAKAWEWHNFNANAYNADNAEEQFRRLIRGSFVTGATLAFRAWLFSTARPFPYDWYHDVWIASVANILGARGIAVPKTLIKYRQHGNQQIGVTRRVDFLGSATRWLSGKTQSRESLAKACADHARGFEALAAKLQAANSFQQSCNSELLDLIRRAATHDRHRAEIFRAKMGRRLGLVMRELANRNYQELSGSGWRAMRDLFI